jgi:hypothetical protein
LRLIPSNRRTRPASCINPPSAAIRQAHTNAAAQRIDAEFLAWDALALDRIAVAGLSFVTVLDSAMSHLFDEAEREQFVEGLGAVVPHSESAVRTHVSTPRMASNTVSADRTSYTIDAGSA